MIFMTKHASIIVSAIAASALALAGCSNSEQDSAQANSAQETAVTTPADDSLDFEDGVVRAMAEDAEMTAIFGTLVNESAQDIEIVGFSSNIDANLNEIHETVNGQMQEMSEPLVIPAGGSVALEPGGAHFMLMEVAEPVMAGDQVTVTVEVSDGTTEEFDEIPVRNIGAGDENYGDLGHAEHGDHAEHDDSDHDDSEHED